MPNSVDQRLASRFHLAQVNLLGRSEAVARAVERVYIGYRKRLLEIAAGASPSDLIQARGRMADLLRAMHTAATDTMESEFRKLIDQGYTTAARILVNTIPPRWFRKAWPTLAVFEERRKRPQQKRTNQPPPAIDKPRRIRRQVRNRLSSVDMPFVDLPPLTFVDPPVSVPLPPKRTPPAKPPSKPPTTQPEPDEDPLNIVVDFEPILQGKVSRDEAKKIISDTVFPPLPPERVRQILNTEDPGGQNWRERMQRWSKRIGDVDLLADSLVEGISSGENLQQLTKRVDPHVGLLRSSAARIARTEGRRVAEVAQRDAWGSLGDMLLGAQIMATLDENTRPEHAHRNGKMYYVDREPRLAEMPNLPDEPNCIIPGQAASGMFCAGLEAFYSGEAIKLTMGTGRTLTVTPNHPVLTIDGFVSAGALNKGDKLIRHRLNGELPCVMPNGVNHAPTSIEDVFSSLHNNVGFAFSRREASGLHLHGDAKFLKGNVDIVYPKRELLAHSESTAKHGASQFGFQRADMKLLGETSGRPHSLTANGVFLSTPGFPGFAELCREQFGIGFDALPFEFLRFGATANLHAGILQSLSQVSATDAETLGELFEGFATEIATDDIVEIAKIDYVGHVYDLQSAVGWYCCNGIIVHNCRCFASPVLKPPEEFENDPALLVSFSNAQGNTIPDPAVYTQWFEKADRSRKMAAVGNKRYREMEQQLGATRPPEWTDFIDEEGKLLSRARLSQEDEPTRAERKQKVQKMINEREQLIRQVAATGFA